MNDRSIVDSSRLFGRRGPKGQSKGRIVDPQALAEVRALLGDAPRERSLLIEHLHRIQDARGCITPAHVVALAQEMKLAPTEVYEVATFYHHFDVLEDGEAPPPPITVRVCETLSCEMAGAGALHAALAARARPLPGDRRAVHRTLRARACGRRRPTYDRPGDGRPGDERGRRRSHRTRALRAHRPRPLPRSRRLSHAGGLCRRKAQRRRGDQGSRELGAARSRRRGLPGRAQMEDRAGRARAAAARGQHRRRRTRHVQGSLLPRARPAPFSRRHADRRMGSGHRCDLRLLARRIRRLPRIADARDRRARSRSAVQAARNRAAARSGSVHLRRGIGDDRIDRGQAGHAAPAPAVRGAGRTVRPPDARAQHGNALLDP